jgi:excinuclease ABC subunit A
VFEGVIPNLERRWKETDSAWIRDEIGRFFSDKPCEVVPRLPAEARGARGQGWRLHIGEVAQKSIRQAESWFTELPGIATESRRRSPSAF